MNIIKSVISSKRTAHVCSKRLYSIITQDAQKLSEHTWDVIISGGGMVGSALACALGK